MKICLIVIFLMFTFMMIPQVKTDNALIFWTKKQEVFSMPLVLPESTTLLMLFSCIVLNHRSWNISNSGRKKKFWTPHLWCTIIHEQFILNPEYMLYWKPQWFSLILYFSLLINQKIYLHVWCCDATWWHTHSHTHTQSEILTCLINE